MNSKYQNGQIYKIISKAHEGKCYIGSTCEELSQRLARHKYMYNQHRKKGKESYRSANRIFDEYGVDNCIIVWIEDYPCNSKKELLAREGHHIKNNDCFNKKVEGRTDKEYREDYKEWEKERHKKYYDLNKDKRKAYLQENKDYIDKWMKEKINCACGSVHTRQHKARHFRSQKHQDWLKQQENQ